MAAKQKKDTELVSSTADTNQSSTITYANEVVAIIAGVAASEVEGIAGMCNIGGSGILSKNRNITRGVKVEIGTEEVSVDLYIIVEYGMPIQKAAHNAQENVRKAIESMTGLHVVRVDVHVQGVSFEKENSTGTLLTGTEHAALTGSGTKGEPAAAASEAAPAEEAEAALQQEHDDAETVAGADEPDEVSGEYADPETEEETPVEISFDDGDTEELVEESDEADETEAESVAEPDESAANEVETVADEENGEDA